MHIKIHLYLFINMFAYNDNKNKDAAKAFRGFEKYRFLIKFS